MSGEQSLVERPVGMRPCSCNHPSCTTWFLTGIGNFVQGSGFTKAEADRIVKALQPSGDVSVDEVEQVARAIYAVRPFVMASTSSTLGGVQISKSFDWDSAPAYYQEDMRQLALAALSAIHRGDGELREVLEKTRALVCKCAESGFGDPDAVLELYTNNGAITAALKDRASPPPKEPK